MAASFVLAMSENVREVCRESLELLQTSPFADIRVRREID